MATLILSNQNQRLPLPQKGRGKRLSNYLGYSIYLRHFISDIALDFVFLADKNQTDGDRDHNDHCTQDQAP
jgi:hypothetical protein